MIILSDKNIEELSRMIGEMSINIGLPILRLFEKIKAEQPVTIKEFLETLKTPAEDSGVENPPVKEPLPLESSQESA